MCGSVQQNVAGQQLAHGTLGVQQHRMRQVQGQGRVAADEHGRCLATHHQRQGEGLGDVLQAVGLLGPLRAAAVLIRCAVAGAEALLGQGVVPGHHFAGHDEGWVGVEDL